MTKKISRKFVSIFVSLSMMLTAVPMALVQPILAHAETMSGSTTLYDDYTINGDTVITDGAVINLNGHTLTVNGNLQQSKGTINVGGGTLYVTGDYRIQQVDGSGNYYWSDSNLVMSNPNDYVYVGGGFYTSSEANSYDSYDDNVFSAGTIEVKGDFFQGGSYASKAFESTGTTVVFSGSGQQTIHFDNPESSYFYSFKTVNTNINVETYG